MFAFELSFGDPIHFPNRFAGELFESNDLSSSRVVPTLHRAVNQLKIERIAVEERSGGHAELNVDFSEAIGHIELPNFLSIEGIASQNAGGKEDPNVLAVGGGRRRCGIPFTTSSVLIAGSDLLAPQLFTVRLDAD